MEDWQINNIIKNLPKLQSWTSCNSHLLAILQAEKILGVDDIQSIECEKKPNCQAKLLYEILLTRRNAFYILANALIETKQTGAAELLLEIPTETLSELQILFLDNKHSLDSLLNPDQIKSIQSWLQKNASVEERLEIHKTVLDQNDPLQLLLDTIPEPDPLYIPRFLICRQVVNPKLFQQECPDVFVFKNANRMELRKVISAYGIEYSTCQLLQREFTVRFMILDVGANWNKICSKVNSPVHLIRYENETKKFLLEETSGDSDVLREYLGHNQEVENKNLSSHEYVNAGTLGSCYSTYSGSENDDASNIEPDIDSKLTRYRMAWNALIDMIASRTYANKCEDDNDNVGISEDNFLKSVFTINEKCIGICDLPGMGKSYLLASLARKIRAEYPDTLTAFIKLQNFKLASNSSTNIPENPQSQLLGQLATSRISQCVLIELVKCKSVKLELFFDGLEEVQEENLEPLLVFFQSLVKHTPDTRIFVTSRPVLQAKLQKTLRVIAYDIKPFNREIQLRYLVTQWAQAEPECDVVKLEAYAQFCLSSFERFLKEKKSNIIGIPLQCKLIADVYSNDAGVYANKNCKIPIELPQNFPGSLLEIYSKFIRRQLGSGNCCNYACFSKSDCFEALCIEECPVKNYHVTLALRLIFPHLAILLEEYVFNLDISTHKLLSPGILKQSKHNGCFEFVHRTFAEYLVAEYIWKGVLLKSDDSSITAIQCGIFKDVSVFVINEGLTYFLDCMVTESQKNVNMQLHFRGSMSPVELKYPLFLKKCIISDYKGLLELCFKATENHKLNGKARQARSFWLFGKSKCSKPALEWKNEDGKKVGVWFSDIIAKDLLKNAAAYCSATTFDKIYNFFFDVLYIDLYDYVWPPPINEAIKRADFELVHYFSKKMSLEKHGLLYKCLQYTYFDTIELVEKKLEIATFLLGKCPSLLTETCTHRHYEYKTPLHTWGIHLELIKFLVQRGCDIRVPNSEDYSIVNLASRYMSDDDFFELCRFMCFECKARDYFLDPANWVTYVSDFTQWAGKHQTKSLFRILRNLELETVFVQDNPFLSTPKVYEKHMEVFHSLIYSAFKKGELDFVNLFLSLDSKPLQYDVYRNVNLHGTDTQHFITATREKRFLTKESNIFVVSSRGQTILHMAARTKDCNFFHAILCMLGELWGETQDIKSLKASTSLRVLSRKPAPENLLELFNWHENEDLDTPLQYAVFYLKDIPVETMDIFLSCGNNYHYKANEFTLVDINAVNKFGVNALTYAIANNQRLELVRHLVNRGADWTFKATRGCNLTHICAETGRVDCLKYFVELGSDVNQPDNMGNNALQCALEDNFFHWKMYVLNGRDFKHIITIIQVLIDAGVDKTHKNKTGKSAYDLALGGKYPVEILSML